jgi:hypothetical protein
MARGIVTCPLLVMVALGITMHLHSSVLTFLAFSLPAQVANGALGDFIKVRQTRRAGISTNIEGRQA